MHETTSVPTTMASLVGFNDSNKSIQDKDSFVETVTLLQYMRPKSESSAAGLKKQVKKLRQGKKKATWIN